MYPGNYNGNKAHQNQRPYPNQQPPPVYPAYQQQPQYPYQAPPPYSQHPPLQTAAPYPYQQPPYNPPPPIAQQPYHQQHPNIPMNVPAGFQLSQCNRNKKALLIGINYFGQQSELKGCINDVENMKRFICQRYGFSVDPAHMVILTDNNPDPNFKPTRLNIINAMKWLVGGSAAGDSLFFHYSGHGGLVKDLNGDEADGYDSCIYPVDHKHAGPIIDDDMHLLMVKFLPPGVRLTAVLDCCHSGTGLDLPYVYHHDGTLKKFNPGSQLISGIKSSGDMLRRGQTVEAAFSLVGNVLNTISGSTSRAEKISQQTNTSMADVIMFAGCKDDQTSADTFIGGMGATGAMSYALIRALNENPQQTYISLLGNIRHILMQKYSQKPQLSTGRPMDMNALFIM